MKITLRLFAGLRERAGVSQLAIELPPGANAGAARDSLLREYPNLTALLARAAIAVNRNYSSLEIELHDGDELAFLPPVSGG
jgi:molybdopterin converting factor subunit 1